MLHESCVQDSIQKLLAGDTDRLPSLLEYYRSRIKKTIRLRFGNQLASRVDPSDVIQEACLEASRKVERYICSPQVSFFVWIRGLAQDALNKQLRQHLGTQRRSIMREVTLPADQSAMFAKQLVTHSSPSHDLLKEEIQLAVKNAISELKETDREVILMRHFEGLSNNEVAESLGITPSTATMRHGRALARLKAVLEKQLVIQSEDKR